MECVSYVHIPCQCRCNDTCSICVPPEWVITTTSDSQWWEYVDGEFKLISEKDS